MITNQIKALVELRDQSKNSQVDPEAILHLDKVIDALTISNDSFDKLSFELQANLKAQQDALPKRVDLTEGTMEEKLKSILGDRFNPENLPKEIKLPEIKIPDFSITKAKGKKK